MLERSWRESAECRQHQRNTIWTPNQRQCHTQPCDPDLASLSSAQVQVFTFGANHIKLNSTTGFHLVDHSQNWPQLHMASCQFQNEKWLVSMNEDKLNFISFSSLLILGLAYHILLSLFCSQITSRCKCPGGRRHPECQSWWTVQRRWASGSCLYLFLLPLDGTAVYGFTCQGFPCHTQCCSCPPGDHMLGPHGTTAVSSDRSQAIDCWALPLPGASSGTSQFIRWRGRDGTQNVDWWILSGVGGGENNPKEVYKSHGWAKLWWLGLVCPNLS